MNDQLTLDVFLRTDKVFENFVVGANQELVKNLSDNSGIETGFFIWGKSGSGKTHLLHAMSCLVQTNLPDSTVVFLPLASNEGFTPEVLQGLESCRFVCLDDIDKVLGDICWEQELFHLINRMKDRGSTLIISSSSPLSVLNIITADLKTRLGQLLNYEVHSLNDEDRKKALTQRAYEKGIRLDSDVVNYIATRGPRNMRELMSFLDLIEKESLKEKRPVTIPFLKLFAEW